MDGRNRPDPLFSSASVHYKEDSQKKEAAPRSGLSLGRKRPRRAYGDKSPRFQVYGAPHKKQWAKAQRRSKSAFMYTFCANVISLHHPPPRSEDAPPPENLWRLARLPSDEVARMRRIEKREGPGGPSRRMG